MRGNRDRILVWLREFGMFDSCLGYLFPGEIAGGRLTGLVTLVVESVAIIGSFYYNIDFIQCY